MLRVGLTGGIACGKSRVRRRLAAAGFGTLDLDGVAHELMAPGGAAYDDVVAAFGRGILAADGTVDRKALGARVFADAAARAELNALVHPRVRDEEARRAAAHAAAGGHVFVTDAALLVEAGLHLRFDRLVVVDCEGGEQLRRLVIRDAIDEGAARARIAAQMPAAEKRRFAHIVLDASGTLEATDAHADALAGELARLAEEPPPRPPVAEAARDAALASGPPRGPHGLDPSVWMKDVHEAGEVELERLKRRLDPPFSGPWFEAAASRPDPGLPGAASLALVVGLWSLGRRGLDPDFTAAVMFSVARLVDRDAARTAGACLVAIGAAYAAAGILSDGSVRSAWASLAERWARSPVPAWAGAVLDAAARPPSGDDRLAAGLAALAAAARA
jgi:dephospho-CoA kinase